ncbi:ABC transporter ATP-binding protein [Salisaeta longa]|uniref:ABC transporter ATP-binding protein n=1 Tax=Salisaeta longa TaxID=503170 RepID=UPI0003B6001B|nr:ABC transporter ATP-binding protein [Salisaeta longa]
MSDPLLTVRGLCKRFTAAGGLVVDDVSFDVAPGEILAILGPSGCGKTTSLRCVAGFERPTAGTVAMEGRVLDDATTHVPPEQRGIGLVFQDFALFPHLSVLENVKFGLRAVPEPARTRQAEKTLELVGLASFAERAPHHLSGGQQQRVALARTLAPAPSLILLDEPFSNLDALLRQGTRQEVRVLLKAKGMSAVLVTHDQEEALSFADRVAVMHNGTIEQVGTPEAVYYEPRTLFVAQFLGRTNLLFSQATGEQADTPLGRVRLNRAAQGTILVSMRPEHLTLDPSTENSGPVGTVIGRAFKGHDITYRVAYDGAEYLVHTHNRMTFRPGDSACIRPLEAGVVLEKDPKEPVTSGATDEPAVYATS